jgi:hypothetical protein
MTEPEDPDEAYCRGWNEAVEDNDAKLRLEALKIADIPNHPPEKIIARAEIFYAFLKGDKPNV